MGLVIKSLADDDARTLANKADFVQIMKDRVSNGGDGHCLCDGCLAFWFLRHYVPEETDGERSEI